MVYNRSQMKLILALLIASQSFAQQEGALRPIPASPPGSTGLKVPLQVEVSISAVDALRVANLDLQVRLLFSMICSAAGLQPTCIINPDQRTATGTPAVSPKK